MNTIFLSLTFIGLFFSPLAADDLSSAPQQGMMQTIVMIGIAMLFFYFILWRPEKKRRKALENQRNQMKQGDKVIAMGIVGTIHKIENETIILKMVDGNKIEVLKGAVTEIVTATPTKE